MAEEYLKILILENDDNDVEIMQTILRERLPQYTIEFQVTETKEEYLQLLREFNPDVILTDFMLPQYNGFQAIEDAIAINSLTPIIIVTGSLSEEDAAESIKHGACDYVVKQRIERLPVAITNALNLSKERKRTKAKSVEIDKLKSQTGLQIKTCFHTIEKAPVLIMITDKHGKIEYVNAKFTEYTGYSLEEVVGKNPKILRSGHQSPEIYEEMWKTILKGNEWKGEFINKKKNGELYWADVSISSIMNEENEIVHFIGIQRDVTEDKKQKIELQQAKEQAEESDKLKSLFLANLSHEIRTPMNGILGFADLLKDRDLTIEERLHFVSIIEQSGHRMLSIINDLIDISKIEAGQMKVSNELIDVHRLGQELFDFFELETNRKKLTLSYQPGILPCLLESDTIKIQQVLTNLIKNAIKFTRTGTIEFGYAIKNKNIHFFVKDTGIGIHPQLQNYIFDRFRQANLSAYKSEEGIGLGLSISKAFVEMLGGEIWVHSELGQGSTFEFTIPISEFQKNTVEQQEFQNAKIADDLIILVAEDDMANYLLLEKILQQSTNAKVIHASDGQKAIEICKTQPIDLVLMDVKMPIIDGIEATKIIKKINPSIAIIIQTAFASNIIKQQAVEAGCDRIISKPIQRNKLLHAISECL